MEILDTIVKREVDLILGSPQPAISHRWELVIKANGKEIKPVFIRDVKLDRLYHKNYADELTVTIGLNYSDYHTNMVPYKSALEATLSRRPLAEGPMPSLKTNSPRVYSNYKVQLESGKSESVEGDSPLAVNKDAAKRAEIIEVRLQLINPVLDYFRKQVFGTVFRDTSPVDAVAWVLMTHSKTASTVAGLEIKGISIDKTFTRKPRNHIVIPPNSTVPAVPMIIDNVVGGIHPAQMRYYLQGQFWYLYPIYDQTRFKDTGQVLTVIKIPKTRLPGVEKTFRVAGNQVVILTTRDTRHIDLSERVKLNDGNGVRFADARNMVKGFAKLAGNKLIAEATKNVSEVLFEPRPDGTNLISSAAGLISDKFNKMYANLAMASGSYIQTIWENCDTQVLIPGMPVRYIFQDGEKTAEMFGTLNAVEDMSYSTTNNQQEPKFVSMALLTLYVSNKNPMNKDGGNPVVSKTSTT